MGQIYEWCCEKCDYSALVSGGADRGFRSFRNTFICNNCEIIMDLSLKVSKNGAPVEKVIFYPFAFFINKHIEFILQEVNNKSVNPKIEYYEDSGKYFVVSKRIITRTFFKDLFESLTANMFVDGDDDIEELKSEKKREKKEKTNRCWYNYLGFKKISFPATGTFYFIPRCCQCNSEDVEIWSCDHVCPKCGGEMKKGRLVKHWD